jgi:hypothetical protein
MSALHLFRLPLDPRRVGVFVLMGGLALALLPAVQFFMGKKPSSAPAVREQRAESACPGQQLPRGVCIQAAKPPAPLPAAVVQVGDGVAVSSAVSEALPVRISLTFDAATLPEPVSADSMDRLAVLTLQAGQWVEASRLALHLHMRAPFDSHVDVLAVRPGYYAIVYRRPPNGVATAKDRAARS